MTVKLVVRVLDADNRLLGWAAVPGHMPGDRCLWVRGNHPVKLTAEGTPAFLSVHWCDLGVQSRMAWTGAPVGQSHILLLHWDGPVMRFASDEGPLPGVTVEAPVALETPTGNLSGTGV